MRVTSHSLLILRNDINGAKGLTMFMALNILSARDSENTWKCSAVASDAPVHCGSANTEQLVPFRVIYMIATKCYLYEIFCFLN